MATTITYTQKQKDILQQFEDFLHDDTHIFILRGYAGTGKTTILKEFVEQASKCSRLVDLMAPTGRAAKILSTKTQRGACTIHRSIYKLSTVESIEGDEENDSKIHYYFPLKVNEVAPDECICIIDEASMVSSRKSGGEVFSFGIASVLDDLLTYYCPEKGGKLVFVGDPAQLPPVGDNHSMALDKTFFEEKGLSVMECELTEILRQDKDNLIQKNSLMIRNLLNSEQRNQFKFQFSDENFSEIEEFGVVQDFVKGYDESLDKEIVICYSNAQTRLYNSFIRRMLFNTMDGDICPDDRLLVISNNYSCPPRDIMNGEFAKVLAVSPEVTKQSARIYINKTPKIVSLLYRDVTLLFEDGYVLETKIIDSLLNNDNRDLTAEEICSMHVNFKMRHKNLKPGTPDYKDAMMKDPYLNAIKVKYGYAITGHKSQGGEWNYAYIDYRGRSGLNDDSLRWCYTVTTRARKKVFAVNSPDIAAFDKLRVDGILNCSKFPDKVQAFENVPEDGFHSNDKPAFLKAKCINLKNHLSGSGYQLLSVTSLPYRERYSIGDKDGNTYIFDAMYNGAEIFRKFTTENDSDIAKEIDKLINVEDEYFTSCSYASSNDVLSELYNKIRSACDEDNIVITNVKEMLPNYKVLYFLYSEGHYRYIEFFINKNFMVTYAKPHSPLGESDEVFKHMLSKIKL